MGKKKKFKLIIQLVDNFAELFTHLLKKDFYFCKCIKAGFNMNE